MIHLVQPCRGHITQRHGNKQSHNGLPHGGQDYAYYSGGTVTDEVFAAADGVVVYAGDARALGWPNQWYYNPDFDRSDNIDQSAGNVVTIRHNQGGVKFDTTYNHLAAWSVKAGDVVKAGQRIATIGATGFSAGKHLHFELLFHPFNFSTATYGRSDPNPYFVTGIAAQGTITSLSEEDIMASLDDLRAVVREEIAKTPQVWFKNKYGADVQFESLLGQLDLNVNNNNANAQAKLDRIVGETVALRAAVTELAKGSSVTAEQVEKAMKEALSGFSLTLTAEGGQ